MDTAPGLTPTDQREYYLLLLRGEVDSLSYAYHDLKSKNDHWSQIIMLVTSLGALITSIMTIAGLKGWYYEIVPIIIQTLAGMIAGYVRFYDFPKRMEDLINIKHSTNEVRHQLERSPAIDDGLWDMICRVGKDIDAVLTPIEREKCHKAALKFQTNEMKRQAVYRGLLRKSNNELAMMKELAIVSDSGSDSSRCSSVVPGIPSPKPIAPIPKGAIGRTGSLPRIRTAKQEGVDGGGGEVEAEEWEPVRETKVPQVAVTSKSSNSEEQVGSRQPNLPQEDEG